MMCHPVCLSNVRFVRGFDGERPSCIEFANRFDDGALLAVVSVVRSIQSNPLNGSPDIGSIRLLVLIFASPILYC